MAKLATSRLLRVIKQIRGDFPEMTSMQIEMLLQVAEDEEINQQDLMHILGWPQGTISRNVQKLSRVFGAEDPKNNPAVVGYDLIDQRLDPTRPRNYLCFLTQKGKR